MLKALELPIDLNLASFSAYLWRLGLAHRIAEEGQHQVIWVADEQDALAVQRYYQLYEAGELQLGEAPPEAAAPPLAPRLYRALLSFPLTLGLVLVTLVLFPASWGAEEGRFSPLFLNMLFVPLAEVANGLEFAALTTVLLRGEYWRLLSPMFIHFGLLHLTFNLLWVWVVARRIEVVSGWRWLLCLTLVSSLASNLTQYLMAGPSLFGGLSGVVFGLLGYAFVFSHLNPAKGFGSAQPKGFGSAQPRGFGSAQPKGFGSAQPRDLGLPKGIYVFLLIYLVLGFSGLLETFFQLSLANGAHLGGLVAGLVIGALAGKSATRQG